MVWVPLTLTNFLKAKQVDYMFIVILANTSKLPTRSCCSSGRGCQRVEAEYTVKGKFTKEKYYNVSYSQLKVN